MFVLILLILLNPVNPEKSLFPMRLKHYSKPPTERNDGRLSARSLPYLWEFKGRVLLALRLPGARQGRERLGAAGAQGDRGRHRAEPQQLLFLPVALFSPTALRLGDFFVRQCDAVFVKVTQHSIRRVALRVFGDLHALSLRFHPSGARPAACRATSSAARPASDFLLNFMLFNILPTLLEIGGYRRHPVRQVRPMVRHHHAGDAGGIRHLYAVGRRNGA